MDGVDRAAITEAFDDVFDQAIVFHGFTDYMRDYEIVVYASADPRTGIQPAPVRYLFKHCVRAVATSALSPEIWSRSLDERLIDYDSGVDLDGYVWGVKWQCLYPGMRLLADSDEAQRWTERLGQPFYEAIAETNGHNISLVFSDLSVTTIESGYTPFVVPNIGPEFKYPIA